MYPTAKRLLDSIVASVLLIMLAPLLVVIAILQRLSGERKVFFLQHRIGHHRKPFKIWKFATMRTSSAERSDDPITLEGDPRVTRLGHFLRITKLNELPQLMNVLRGEMSIVGPRPLIPESFAQYPERIKRCCEEMRPGITGIGSIVFRNESYFLTRTNQKPANFYRDHILPYKGELEYWYFWNRSFRTDFFLLLLTLYALFVPSTLNLVFRVFPTLPEPPIFLKKGASVNLNPLPNKKKAR